MRIAFWVRVGNKYGGLEKYIAAFAELCHQSGHDFLLINEIQNNSIEFRKRLSKVYVEQIVVGESLKSPFKVFSRTIKILINWKPDVVQLHFINSLAVPLLRIVGVPLIYQTYHSSIEHSITLRTRFFRQLDNIFSTHVFGISEHVCQDQIKAGVKPSKIKKIVLGLNPLDFLKNYNVLLEPKPPLWNNSNLIKIITIGRFFPIKGMRFVVEAAINVIKNHKDVIWWIVGKEGPDSHDCQKMIQDAGLAEKIIILGERNDVPALLNLCDFQVVGSLSEGLPLMALEAAICGVPTVGTQVGGLCEAIVNGETGLLVEPSSSTELANATEWMLDHPEQRKILGAAAKRYVMKNFNSEVEIKKLLHIFESDYESKVKHGKR